MRRVACRCDVVTKGQCACAVCVCSVPHCRANSTDLFSIHWCLEEHCIIMIALWAFAKVATGVV